MRVSRILFRTVAPALVSVLWAWPSLATETITYTYDAGGRLVRVVKTGTVNNGVQVQYEIDKAGNRVKVTTTGAPN